MNISPLQKARYEYSPKLPGMLRHGIADICVKEGEATQSVADQDKIKALFPNTYGKKEITFEKGQNTSACKEAGSRRYPFRRTGTGRTQRYLRSVRCIKGNQSRRTFCYGFKGGPSGLIEDNYVDLR